MSGSNANDLTATSLLTGFLTGKLGLFGLKKQEVAHDAMNWCSMIFVVASMVVFFFIKPTINKREEYKSLDEKPVTRGGIQEEPEESSFVDRIPAKSRFVYTLLSPFLKVRSILKWQQEHDWSGTRNWKWYFVRSEHGAHDAVGSTAGR